MTQQPDFFCAVFRSLSEGRMSVSDLGDLVSLVNETVTERTFGSIETVAAVRSAGTDESICLGDFLL